MRDTKSLFYCVLKRYTVSPNQWSNHATVSDKHLLCVAERSLQWEIVFQPFSVVLPSKMSLQMRGCSDNLVQESVKGENKFEMRQSANKLLKCPHWVNQRRFCCPSQLDVSHLPCTHTADVCGSSNEAPFVPMSQGLGCSGAEMRPTMLSLRFWSSCFRSCSTAASPPTEQTFWQTRSDAQSEQLPFLL